MNVTSPTMAPWSVENCAESAAAEVGVRLYNLRRSGKGIAFTLKTGEKDTRRVDWRCKLVWSARYQRLSQRERLSLDPKYPGTYFQPVIPGAVCWHGHRDFLRALYARVPDAKVRTAMATYLNREHFESTYAGTYYHGGERMGSRMLPYGEACTCAE